jgi:hypothetical protein
MLLKGGGDEVIGTKRKGREPPSRRRLNGYVVHTKLVMLVGPPSPTPDADANLVRVLWMGVTDDSDSSQRLGTIATSVPSIRRPRDTGRPTGRRLIRHASATEG